MLLLMRTPIELASKELKIFLGIQTLHCNVSTDWDKDIALQRLH